MEPSEVPLPSDVNEDLSPLEQDVLDEYERLAENMRKVVFSVSYEFLYSLFGGGKEG